MKRGRKEDFYTHVHIVFTTTPPQPNTTDGLVHIKGFLCRIVGSISRNRVYIP